MFQFFISAINYEIKELCDEATILRNGKVTGYVLPSENSTSELAKLMIGRELPTYAHVEYTGEHRTLFQVKPELRN